MQIVNFIKKILLWPFRPKRYAHLYRTIRATRPLTIMEIGTWNGERAVRMIRLAQQLRPGEEIHYVGFDLFELMTPEKYEEEISKHPPTRAEVEQRIAATGARVTLVQGDTTETMPPLVADLPPMDFVFLDGGHSVRTIASDWGCVEKLMHDATVVIFDDYWEDNLEEGAKAVIDNIDRAVYDVAVLEPQDRFKKDWGVLRINFARVARKTGAPAG